MIRLRSIFAICCSTMGVMLTIALLSHTQPASGIYPIPDDFYKSKWCTEHQGATDVKISDGTTADCITSTHVLEFQLAPNWADAIGRSLYYSRETGKKAGIVLIIKTEKDQEDWKRLKAVISHFGLPIDAWKME
jgi:hypothetical protein